MESATPQPFPADIPFLHDLGAIFLGMGNGASEIGLDLAPRHMNSWHVTHGGVIMTMLDVAMAMAGRSLNPEAQGGVTIEMKTSFLQPGGKAGERIIAKGKAFHQTKTMCFCEADLWIGDKLAARATGTFKFLRRLDAGKRLEQPSSSDLSNTDSG